MSVVTGQAALAARSLNAMQCAMVKTLPGFVLPRNNPEDEFVSCVRHVTGKTLTPMQRAALHRFFYTNLEICPLLVLMSDQVASF